MKMEANKKAIEDKFSIDDLFITVWQIRTSEQFIAFIDKISIQNYYSLYNKVLVYIQNSSIDLFGSMSFWKKRGRLINKEAKPYLIIAPNGPIKFVYDIYETRGKLSPNEYLIKVYGEDPNGVKGEIDVNLYNIIENKVRSWGIKLDYKPMSFFKGGHITNIKSKELEINLNEKMSVAEKLSVLIHELAHLFLGHLKDIEIFNTNTQKTILIPHRNIEMHTREFEAETVSFLITKRLGLETRSAEYLAGYFKSEKDFLQFGYEKVIKTTDKIESLFIKH